MSLPWHQRPPLNVRTKLDGMPTMLWREERLFLYHVARDLYQGRGEIVDLGAFLGGSAACFAAGLRDRRWGCDTRGRIHSFDLFEYAPHHAPFLPDFVGGQDTVPTSVRLCLDESAAAARCAGGNNPAIPTERFEGTEAQQRLLNA